MARYRETDHIEREPEEYRFSNGPEVQRDCMMTTEIAEHLQNFALHTRPRYYRPRDREWTKQGSEE